MRKKLKSEIERELKFLREGVLRIGLNPDSIIRDYAESKTRKNNKKYFTR